MDGRIEGEKGARVVSGLRKEIINGARSQLVEKDRGIDGWFEIE